MRRARFNRRTKWGHIFDWSIERDGEPEMLLEVWGTPTPGERETRDDPGCAPGVDDLYAFAAGHGGDMAYEVELSKTEFADMEERAWEWLAYESQPDEPDWDEDR